MRAPPTPWFDADMPAANPENAGFFAPRLQLRDVRVGVENVDPATGQRRLSLESPRRAMTVHDLMRHTAGFTYCECWFIRP